MDVVLVFFLGAGVAWYMIAHRGKEAAGITESNRIDRLCREHGINPEKHGALWKAQSMVNYPHSDRLTRSQIEHYKRKLDDRHIDDDHLAEIMELLKAKKLDE